MRMLFIFFEKCHKHISFQKLANSPSQIAASLVPVKIVHVAVEPNSLANSSTPQINTDISLKAVKGRACMPLSKLFIGQCTGCSICYVEHEQRKTC